MSLSMDDDLKYCAAMHRTPSSANGAAQRQRRMIRSSPRWRAILLLLWIQSTPLHATHSMRLRSEVYADDDADIAYLYDYFERLFDALYNNPEHRQWYSGSPTGESWAEHNCDLNYDFRDWRTYEMHQLRGILLFPIVGVDSSLTAPFNLEFIHLENSKAVGKLEKWMIDDISSAAHPYLHSRMKITERIHLSGNITEFITDFTEPPLLRSLEISHFYKESDGDTWQGITGRIPTSLTTWMNLSELVIDDQNLYGDLPYNLSHYYMPKLNFLSFMGSAGMCGAIPFAGGGVNGLRANDTQIGEKMWDEELQQCVDPPPPPPDVPLARLLPYPPPVPLAPPPESEPAASEATSSLTDDISPGDAPESSPSVPPDVPEESVHGAASPDAAPPFIEPFSPKSSETAYPHDIEHGDSPDIQPDDVPTSEVSSVAPSSLPQEQDLEMTSPSPSADVDELPISVPASSPAPFSLNVCTRQTGVRLFSPTITKSTTFPVLLLFDSEQDVAVYCTDTACQLTDSDDNLLAIEPFRTLDAASRTATLRVGGEGEVILRLSPRAEILEQCGDGVFPAPNRTVTIDTTPPRLQHRIDETPKASSARCALTLFFNEPVQNFATTSLSLTNADLLAFSGNGTHFDVVMLGRREKNISLFVPFVAYRDLAGNYGDEDFAISIPVPSSSVSVLAGAGSAAVLGTMAATSALSMTSAVSSGSSAGGGGNFVRAVGHTQFLAMCTSLAVPHLPSEFLSLSDGYKWSLLSSEDKPSAIVETTKTKDTPRQLESNATSDWLDSLTTTYGHFSDGADNSQTDVTERPTVKATRRSRMTRSRLWAKIAISMAIYALCCCIHYFLTRIIRLFKPSVKLPFALTFPKPQVTIAVMSIPPLMYNIAMAAQERHREDAAVLCALLPLPCALYLLYAVLRPSLSDLTLRRNRISTWEKSENVKLQPEGPDPSSTFDKQAQASIPVQLSSEREDAAPASSPLTKAFVGSLGKAPTLLLEGQVDATHEREKQPPPPPAMPSRPPTMLVFEDVTGVAAENDISKPKEPKIDREDVASTSVIAVQGSATQELPKSAIDSPVRIAEGLEFSKPVRRVTSSKAPLLDAADAASEWQVSALLEKYGPLFDDVIGTDNRRAARHGSVACLLSPFFHFLSRIISALLFGIFDLDDTNRLQVRLLFTLHAALLGYLLFIRPYANRALMLAEIVCHFCEWGILSIVLVLSEMGRSFDLASTCLFIFAYIDIGTLTLYEIVRMAKHVMQVMCRKKDGQIKEIFVDKE